MTWPETKKDTVLYEKKEYLADQDQTVRMLDSTKAEFIGDLNLYGTVNGQPYSSSPYINVRNFGAKGDGITDDTYAVQAAITAATNGGRIVFPVGTYKITADLNINRDNIELCGVGAASILAFVGAGIHLNGIDVLHYGQGISDLYITRTGAVGPAIRISGGNQLTTVRWKLSGVHVQQSTGPGLSVDGSYIGDLFGCYFQQSAVGVEFKLDSTGTQVAGNAIHFFGGEIYGNYVAATLDSVASVTFDGVCIEGNASGVTLSRSCRGVLFSGCYFEGNTDFDVRVGNVGTCSGVSFIGCLFFSAPPRPDSVILIRSLGTFLGGNYWSGYSAAPLRIAEATPGEVIGYEWGNQATGGTGVVNLVAGVNWHRMPYVRTDTNSTLNGELMIIAPDAGTHLGLWGNNMANLRFGTVAVNGGFTVTNTQMVQFVKAGSNLSFLTADVERLSITDAKMTCTTALDVAGVTTFNGNMSLAVGKSFEASGPIYSYTVVSNDLQVPNKLYVDNAIKTRTITTKASVANTGILTDAGQYLRFTGTNPTYTVPPNATVAFPIGSEIEGISIATTMTIVVGAGVTINRSKTLVTALPKSWWTLVKVATDTWDLRGEFA